MEVHELSINASMNKTYGGSGSFSLGEKQYAGPTRVYPPFKLLPPRSPVTVWMGSTEPAALHSTQLPIPRNAPGLSLGPSVDTTSPVDRHPA